MCSICGRNRTSDSMTYELLVRVVACWKASTSRMRRNVSQWKESTSALLWSKDCNLENVTTRLDSHKQSMQIFNIIMTKAGWKTITAQARRKKGIVFCQI